MNKAGLLVLLGTIGVQAMTVDEAYRAIPHRQTVFQASSAQMSAAEREYLVAFFQAIDLAIVAKMSTGRGKTVVQNYEPVWKAWETLKPSSQMKATQDRVKSAIEDQQAYLQDIEHKKTVWNTGHPKVQSASGKLHAAYGDLMRLYPRENATNQQAFFDYLCALDFV